MATITASKTLNENLMALWYNTNDSATTAGELMFGGVDPSKVLGNTTYYNISSQRDYWRLSLDNIIFSNGGSLPNVARSIVVDSGTTYVLIGKDLADAINVRIGAMTMEQGLYTIDCNQVLSVPPIKFYFAGNSKDPLILQGRQLVRHIPGTSKYRGVCISIFQESTVIQNGKAVTIFGALFLRNFVSVFHYDNSTVGFANPVGLPDPTLPFSSAPHAYTKPIIMALLATLLCISI